VDAKGTPGPVDTSEEQAELSPGMSRRLRRT
jgi:hypothetical protein